MQLKPVSQLHVLDDEPPIRIAKPWFAQGWVLGVLLATAATVFTFYQYGFQPRVWMVLLLVLLWLLAVLKFFKGVRYLEFYNDAVLTYGLHPSKPIAQLPYDRMTVVLDADEIFYIRKAKFTGGFSLKRVYWKHDWEQLKTIFSTNAAYTMRNYIQKGRGGFETTPLPTPRMQSRNRGFGIFGAMIVLYEVLVGLLLWLPYKLTESNKTGL